MCVCMEKAVFICRHRIECDMVVGKPSMQVMHNHTQQLLGDQTNCIQGPPIIKSHHHYVCVMKECCVYYAVLFGIIVYVDLFFPICQRIPLKCSI